MHRLSTAILHCLRAHYDCLRGEPLRPSSLRSPAMSVLAFSSAPPLVLRATHTCCLCYDRLTAALTSPSCPRLGSSLSRPPITPSPHFVRLASTCRRWRLRRLRTGVEETTRRRDRGPASPDRRAGGALPRATERRRILSSPYRLMTELRPLRAGRTPSTVQARSGRQSQEVVGSPRPRSLPCLSRQTKGPFLLLLPRMRQLPLHSSRRPPPSSRHWYLGRQTRHCLRLPADSTRDPSRRPRRSFRSRRSRRNYRDWDCRQSQRDRLS